MFTAPHFHSKSKPIGVQSVYFKKMSGIDTKSGDIDASFDCVYLFFIF